MYRLTRRTNAVRRLLTAVSIRNGRSILQQELANPKLIPAAIVLDRQGYRLCDFGTL